MAGLFAAYLYDSQSLPRDFVPDSRLKARYMPDAMRLASEQYACEILDNAQFDGSNAAFDEYIFYGIDEESGAEFKEFMGKRKQQLDNANLRSALQLMGVDPRTEVTHLDLALQANSKLFMNQAGVRQFLDRLWRRPSNNGDFVQNHLEVAPCIKGFVKLAGFTSFIVIYMVMMANLPARDEPFTTSAIETVFWVWALTFLLSEVFEAHADFDTLRQVCPHCRCFAVLELITLPMCST